MARGEWGVVSREWGDHCRWRLLRFPRVPPPTYHLPSTTYRLPPTTYRLPAFLFTPGAGYAILIESAAWISWGSGENALSCGEYSIAIWWGFRRMPGPNNFLVGLAALDPPYMDLDFSDCAGVHRVRPPASTPVQRREAVTGKPEATATPDPQELKAEPDAVIPPSSTPPAIPEDKQDAESGPRPLSADPEPPAKVVAVKDVTERYPDGTKVTRKVKELADGTLVNDGPYTEWHANGQKC